MLLIAQECIAEEENMVKLSMLSKHTRYLYIPDPHIKVINHILREIYRIMERTHNIHHKTISIHRIFKINNINYMEILIDMHSFDNPAIKFYGAYDNNYVPYGKWKKNQSYPSDGGLIFKNGRIIGDVDEDVFYYGLTITDEYIIFNSKHLYIISKKYVHNIHINDDSKSFISVKNVLGEIKITVDNDYIYFTRNGNLYKKEFNSDKIILGINGETTSLINALWYDII